MQLKRPKPPKVVRDPAREADVETVRQMSAEILALQEQISERVLARKAAMTRLRARGVVLRDLAKLSGLSVQTVKVQTDSDPG